MHNVRLLNRVWMLVVCCLFTGALVSVPVHAQSIGGNGFNLTTSPVYVTLTTKPGATVSTPIKVQNNAAKAVTLHVKLMKFQAHGTDGGAQLLTPAANDLSAKWVSFSTDTIVAQPGAWNTVAMTIHPDHTAAFGYYYAVAFTNAEGQAAQHVNTVTGSSAVLVLLDVQVPGEKRQLSVSHFRPQQSISQFLPVTFDVSVKNSGDIYGAPTGDIYISRSSTSKDTLAVIPVNEAQGNVLPGSTRTMNVAWDDGFPAHVVQRINGQIVTGPNGQPATQLSWDASKLGKFRFGHYYAHLLLVYNNGTQDVPIEAETSFWVIPWWPIIISLVIISLTIFGLVSLLRRTVHVGRRLAKHAKKHEKPKPEA